MSIIGKIKGPINKVVDKERKINLVNKVNQVIAEEEQRANEAFIALGKYYYYNLRDAENDETEFYCCEADYAERRLQRAELKLAELTRCESEIYEFTDEDFEEAFKDWNTEDVNDEWPAEMPVEGAGDEGVAGEVPHQVQAAMEQAAEETEEKTEE